MGNNWLADAWGDNPLSDPAISDAETISDAAEGKATGFSDWHPAAHGHVEDKPDPDSAPYRSSSSRSLPRTRGEGRQLNMMQNPVHKTLHQKPQQGVHRAPVRSVETRTGKRIPAPQEHRKIALRPGYWGSSCRGRTYRKSTEEETVIRSIIS